MRIVALLAAVLVSASACGSSGPGSAGEATVTGRVLSAPSCPVERADSPCPPRPVANASVVALRGQETVASTHTDATGRFRLQVQPGRYLIRATNVGGLGSTAEKSVLVKAGQTTRLTLTVDSGIR
jgi:hypothetical protein